MKLNNFTEWAEFRGAFSLSPAAGSQMMPAGGVWRLQKTN